MTVRVEVVTQCEHGGMSPHLVGDTTLGVDLPECFGGSRRTFTEWPPEAIEAAVTALDKVYAGTLATSWLRRIVNIVLAAVWSHITGDNK